MTAELPTAFRFVLRMLSIACLLLCAQFAVGQTPSDYCEPSAAVKEDFKKIAQLEDEELPYKVRLGRELAMLQELLKKYPGDFHVQRRYQIARISGYVVDRDPLLAEYRKEILCSLNIEKRWRRTPTIPKPSISTRVCCTDTKRKKQSRF